MNPGLPEEQSFPVPVGSITIGRTKDNDVHFLHKSLSRKHAKVEFDGERVRIVDLQSKNGLFYKGRRVVTCELGDGESFRCGDITFLLEGATTRTPRMSAPAQTLPSPLAMGPSAGRRPTKVSPAQIAPADGQRYKERLSLLFRASELLVAEMTLDRLLDELLGVAVKGIEVDRIALLVLDEATLEMRPRVVKSFTSPMPRPYSRRVVDWVVDHNEPASFPDVSRDQSLRGDPEEDRTVRAAMAVPVNPGGGTIGVLYADTVTKTDAFLPDDLALLRALANLAAVAIEGDALRRVERDSIHAPR